jgi:hypothetical protein
LNPRVWQDDKILASFPAEYSEKPSRLAAPLTTLAMKRLQRFLCRWAEKPWKDDDQAERDGRVSNFENVKFSPENELLCS